MKNKGFAAQNKALHKAEAAKHKEVQKLREATGPEA